MSQALYPFSVTIQLIGSESTVAFTVDAHDAFDAQRRVQDDIPKGWRQIDITRRAPRQEAG